MLVEVGRSKGQRVLPLPVGWQQGKAMGRDEPATPRSQGNNDVADLEASVVTWRHLLQGILSVTPQAAVQVTTHRSEIRGYIGTPMLCHSSRRPQPVAGLWAHDLCAQLEEGRPYDFRYQSCRAG